MAKRAPSAIIAMYPIVDQAFKSMERLGILEGSAAGEGFHHSREDLIRRGKDNAYSIRHDLDKQGKPDAACAIDFGFNDTEMKIATKRIYDAARAKDPRLYLKCREFGGTLDGKNVTAFNVTEQRSISFDDTHLWHLHVSIHRAYADDIDVCRGIAEVVAGIALEEELDMDWPSCMPYPEGARLKVSTPAGLKARTAPLVNLSTELRRDGNPVTVAAGYPLKVEACAFVDGIWWIRGGTYWYAAGDAAGKSYWKKAA